MASNATALTVVDRVDRSPAIALLEQRAEVFLPFLGTVEAVERLRQGVAVAMVKNPDLLSCTPESVFLAAREAVMQGLEPTGAAGGAHLVPYKSGGDKIAQLIPDYRGVIRLVTKPGSDVQSLEARVVKEGDEFAYRLGTDAFVDHIPSLAADRSQKATTHVYAVARLRDGSTIPDVEDRAGIERIQKKSRSGAQGPWATDWDEMAKKTIIKRLAKVLPVRPEVRALLVREDELAEGDAAETPAEPTGPTKASRLGSRLRSARNVTPTQPEAPGQSPEADAPTDTTTDPVAAADPAARDVAQESGLTKEQLLNELTALDVSVEYATEKAKRMFYPDGKAKGALTAEQRLELVEALRAEEVEDDQATAGL